MTMDLDAEFSAARARVNRSIGQNARYARAYIRAVVAFELHSLERRWMTEARRPVRYVMPDTLDRRTACMITTNGWPL